MTDHLVATRPFLSFVKGDIISEAHKMSEILSTEYKKFVTKVASPSTPKG